MQAGCARGCQGQRARMPCARRVPFFTLQTFLEDQAYELSDRNIITVGVKCFRHAEVSFQPSSQPAKSEVRFILPFATV